VQVSALSCRCEFIRTMFGCLCFAKRSNKFEPTELTEMTQQEREVAAAREGVIAQAKRTHPTLRSGWATELIARSARVRSTRLLTYRSTAHKMSKPREGVPQVLAAILKGFRPTNYNARLSSLREVLE
jgi:hypothetical protein